MTKLTRRLAAIAAALTLAAASVSAQAGAAAMYERAQARESAIAGEPAVPVETLRQIARSYEAIALRYPTSGYSDNALWQAALLAKRAFEMSGDTKDRDDAARLHSWLKREYPHSSLARQSLEIESSGHRGTGASDGRDAVIRAIAATPLPQGDRVTIELSKEVRFEGQRVTNPDRIFFDFTNANAASVLIDRARAIKSALIKTVRVGVPTPGVTRVVFELAGEPRFSSFPLYHPFRLVIDFESTAAAMPVSMVPPAPAPGPTTIPTLDPPAPEKPAPERSAPPKVAPERSGPERAADKTIEKPVAEKPAATDAPPAVAVAKPAPAPAPPSSTRDGDYSLARQLGLRVARIVIDPGHGGHDPGALANGVTEAELVLDVALKLEKLLQQVPGVEVVLTRRTNEFIPLEERTAIANRERADLFLSVHANSHRQPAVRGIETYFLNFATNSEAEAVAARENATSSQTMGTLPAIVRAIALNNKIAESRELASIVQTIMVRKMRVQSAGVRDLGVKQAPFVVLIGAQMPSVLTEIAFVTNRAEASLLKQQGYRQQIAQALRDAIVRYRESLKKVTTVASGAR